MEFQIRDRDPVPRQGRSRREYVLEPFPVEVVDHGETLCVAAVLPGQARSDLGVTVTSQLVEIDARDDRGSFGRDRGSMRRQIRLPSPVIAEQATASYDEGILEIIVPKVGPPPVDSDHRRS